MIKDFIALIIIGHLVLMIEDYLGHFVFEFVAIYQPNFELCIDPDQIGNFISRRFLIRCPI